MTRHLFLPVVLALVLAATGFLTAAVMLADDDDDAEASGAPVTGWMLTGGAQVPAVPVAARAQDAAGGDAELARSSIGVTGTRFDTALPVSGRAISVQGYGLVTNTADLAELQFLFGAGYMDQPMPTPGPGEMPGVTLDDLQPVVDALIAAGVAQSDISVSLLPGGGYYGKGGESGQVLVRVASPTTERLQELVGLATEAAFATGKLQVYNIGAKLTVNDCAALLQQALQEALADAGERAGAIAAEIGVTVGEVQYVSDNGTGDPYGMPGCGQPYPYPEVYYPGWDPNMGAEVRVFRSIGVTYSVE